MFYAIKVVSPTRTGVEWRFAESYEDAAAIVREVRAAGDEYKAFAWDAAEQVPEHFEQ